MDLSNEEIKAEVKARRPALKASGHVVAGRFVGSLFHCLNTGKGNGKGLGGLPLHVGNAGLPRCELYLTSQESVYKQ